MAEQLLHDHLAPAPSPESTKETAAPSQLFEIDQAQITALYPSVTAGNEALIALRESTNPLREKDEAADEASDETQETPETVAEEATPLAETKSDTTCGCGRDHSVDEDAPITEFNRKTLRSNFNTYKGPMMKFITHGTQFLASYEDPQEGEKAGEKLLKETGSDLFIQIWKVNIVPAATPIRKIHEASRATKAELDMLTQTDPETRYKLLKTFATPAKSKEELIEADMSDDSEEESKHTWQPVQVLHALTTLSGSDAPRQLTAELNSGAYDPFIAKDVLEFVDNNPDVGGDLARVRQFAAFMTKFVGGDQNNKAEIHARMIQMLDSWPAAERQALVEARSILSATTSVNAGRAGRWLRERGFSDNVDRTAAFVSSADALTSEYIKRVPLGNPLVRSVIMGLRAQIKGRRAKRGKNAANTPAVEDSAPEALERKEPMKLLTCNLNDHTTTEGVEGLITEYMQELGQQGNKHLRDDLDKIVTFMARTDLIENSRRGVKPISGVQVRFGPEDKLWDFLEFKPSAAADLALKTQQAKNSRTYFIRLDGETLGLVGIKPRSKQDIFIRSIRDRRKRRG